MFDRRFPSRLLGPAAACLMLAGCQSMPFSQQDQEQPPATPDTPEANAGEPREASLDLAIDLLQDGEEQHATRLLEDIVDDRPDDATARLLLEQIRRDPETLLGNEFEEVEVRPGESLSAIAERTIGNGLLFYALARLNGIEVPRLLRAGQRLRVPVDSSAETPDSTEADDANAVAAGESDANRTALALIERERYVRAYSLLLDTARAGELDQDGRLALAEAAVHLSREAGRDDDLESADRYLAQAAPWLPGISGEGAFARQRAMVDSRIRLDEAERFLASGDEVAAFEALMAAREASGDKTIARGAELARLEKALADHFHDRALSAWRDQQVDLSVELWDRVVRIDPDFEPAIRYLERARRAQRELQALGDG